MNGVWGTAFSGSNMFLSGSVGTGSSVVRFSGLGYGKYRIITSISDITGNKVLVSSIFYVDSISWEISRDRYDIANITL